MNILRIMSSEDNKTRFYPFHRIASWRHEKIVKLFHQRQARRDAKRKSLFLVGGMLKPVRWYHWFFPFSLRVIYFVANLALVFYQVVSMCKKDRIDPLSEDPIAFIIGVSLLYLIQQTLAARAFLFYQYWGRKYVHYESLNFVEWLTISYAVAILILNGAAILVLKHVNTPYSEDSELNYLSSYIIGFLENDIYPYLVNFVFFRVLSKSIFRTKLTYAMLHPEKGLIRYIII